MRKNILLVSFVSAFLLTQTACEDGKDEFLDDFSTTSNPQLSSSASFLRLNVLSSLN